MSTPNRYSLSDADMLGIFERINRANSPGGVVLQAVTATWDAVLSQEGSSFVQATSHDGFDVTAYSIPQDQASEIADRMLKQLGILKTDPLTSANAAVDWANYAPATYSDAPSVVAHPPVWPNYIDNRERF